MLKEWPWVVAWTVCSVALVGWLELEGSRAGGPDALGARAALAWTAGAGMDPGVLALVPR